ncbi:MAG: nicotinate-nucleotide--dimethylbenzimidazole [Chitinophagaceae bacterium]|nr:MAG: nicotinate-nucleotide--dimethylbenzimidazole [Chitinophagaceae bacterium]
MNYDFSHLNFSDWFIHAKQGLGTKNYLEENAMSMVEVSNTINKGKEIVQSINAKGCNCIGFGEMGIGNTSAAALIMSAITQLSIEECTGYGTGVNEAQLETKMNTLSVVHLKHQLQDLQNNPFQLLSKVGGFEIAMMMGAFLEAFEKGMVIVVDGFIATAALLLAQQIEKDITSHCIFAHTSGEKGHEKMLQYLQAKPLLNLGMRLGEGTGAAIAMPIIQSAVAFSVILIY